MTKSDKDMVPKTRRKPGRVPTSCAECRRLKLRCDKNVPCEKCVSRGCGSICPDGSLTPGKGNRLILANTEELHDRIDTLCARNRELEAALRIAQQLVSDQPHPLLQKNGTQPIAPRDTAPSSNATPLKVLSVASSEPTADHPRSYTEADDENLVDAFGTLTLGARGQSSFHGSTARSEILIRALDQQQPPTAPITRRLSKAIVDASCPDVCDPAIIEEALSLLPPLSEAVRLCEIYQEYGKFLYTPVPRTELFDEILVGIYRVDRLTVLSCLDSLSLLFSIFALGALFDPEREAYSVESQEYYYLARAVLRFGSRPSRNLIQAHSCDDLHIKLRLEISQIHVAHHLEFSDWDSTRSHTTWMYIGHAVRLAQSPDTHWPELPRRATAYNKSIVH
ncbi:hypothetical protein H0H92_013213 [Tricholoma furcatifolium]|nr:hypothetical protein H0H92_013213 [Tricholoma furcatifolium]